MRYLIRRVLNAMLLLAAISVFSFALLQWAQVPAAWVTGSRRA